MPDCARFSIQIRQWHVYAISEQGRRWRGSRRSYRGSGVQLCICFELRCAELTHPIVWPSKQLLLPLSARKPVSFFSFFSFFFDFVSLTNYINWLETDAKSRDGFFFYMIHALFQYLSSAGWLTSVLMKKVRMTAYFLYFYFCIFISVRSSRKFMWIAQFHTTDILSRYFGVALFVFSSVYFFFLFICSGLEFFSPR